MTDKTGEAGPMQVDTDLVRKLADLLSDGELSEIEVQDGDRKIVVKRKIGMPSYAAPVPALTPAPTPPPVAAPLAPEASPAGDPALNPGAVKSPMVGTVYLSAEPGSDPFITPGTAVSAGDTLVIVEAMKVMNPITAPKAGTVRQILVENAQPVEYDQALVIID